MGLKRSLEYTAVAVEAFEAWRARTARECSDSPNFAVHDIRVDFKECEDNLRSSVFGERKIRLKNSEPSSELSGRSDHVVAEEFMGQRIIGPGPLIGKVKLH